MKLKKAIIPAGSMKHIFGIEHPDKEMDFSDMVGTEVSGGDFWGDRIHTVAAIVGSNGSGKSSILNGIKNGGIDVDFDRIYGLASANNLAIFYSPFLDDSYTYEGGNFNCIDVSRYYEIERDTTKGISSFSDAYTLHESFQLMRNVNLLNQDSENEIISDDLHLPKYSRIQIKTHLYSIESRNVPNSFRPYFRELNNIKTKEREVRRGADIFDEGAYNQNELKLNILTSVSMIVQEVLEGGDDYYAGRYVEEGMAFERDFTEFDDLEEAFVYFIDHAQIQLGNEIITLPVEELKILVRLFLDNLSDGIEIKDNITMYVNLSLAARIMVAYNNVLIAFMKYFTYGVRSHLAFKPSIRLSSGEKSMYDILSGLHNLEYHLNNKTDRYKAVSGDLNLEQPKNLLFLFDEADLDFHPLWKKRFISIITKALPRIFPNDTMSIIFTTHDPLTLSDMPSKNVFYLEKREGVTKFADRKLGTFAANISDLLSDSFFVEDGLIGDFAKNKINEIIDWISANRKTEDRVDDYADKKEKYKEWISYIDEPITRIKLSEMIGELDDDGIESRNRMIDEEIERLTKLKEMP